MRAYHVPAKVIFPRERLSAALDLAGKAWSLHASGMPGLIMSFKVTGPRKP